MATEEGGEGPELSRLEGEMQALEDEVNRQLGPDAPFASKRARTSSYQREQARLQAEQVDEQELMHQLLTLEEKYLARLLNAGFQDLLLSNELHLVPADIFERLAEGACEVDNTLHGLVQVENPELDMEFFVQVMESFDMAKYEQLAKKRREEVIMIILHSAVLPSGQAQRGWIRTLAGLKEMKVAIAKDDVEKLKGLVPRRPSLLIARDFDGQTLLHYTASSGSLNCIKYLAAELQKNVGVQEMADAMDAGGNTPLHVCARENSVEVAQFLLEECGAYTDFKNCETNGYGNGQWLRKPLKAKSESVKRSETDRQREGEGNNQLAEEEFQPIDQENQTPLHIAVEEGFDDFVDLLMRHGANPNIPDMDRRTALHVALDENQPNIMRMLLGRGADVRLTHLDMGEGSTILHEAAKKGKGEEVELLLKFGGAIFVNTLGDDWLPLQLAARSGSVRAVKALLGAGADAAATGSKGKTALDLAKLNKRVDVVQLLSEESS